MLNYAFDVSTKVVFYMKFKRIKKSLLPRKKKKKNTINVHAKLALEQQLLIGVNTLT